MTTYLRILALAIKTPALRTINTQYYHESARRYHTQGPDLYALPQAKGALE